MILIEHDATFGVWPTLTSLSTTVAAQNPILQAETIDILYIPETARIKSSDWCVVGCLKRALAFVVSDNGEYKIRG